jgi:murein DD-endopeptidase MepM/ murein hydrolase activator NlpD
MPFTLDWGSHDWDSQDVGPAMREIIKRVRPMQWPNQWPVDPDGTIIVGPPPVAPSDKTVVVFPKFSGKITGFYGSMYTNAAGTQYPHEGLDIALPSGTPVYAPFDGVVAFSDVDDLYGEYIRTYHKDLNVCFFFAHLEQRLVNNGDVIKSGQLIGHTGNSGNSTGSHLHFEVRWMVEGSTLYRTGISARERSRIDPLAWLAGWQSMGGKVIEK